MLPLMRSHYPRCLGRVSKPKEPFTKDPNVKVTSLIHQKSLSWTSHKKKIKNEAFYSILTQTKSCHDLSRSRHKLESRINYDPKSCHDIFNNFLQVVDPKSCHNFPNCATIFQIVPQFRWNFNINFELNFNI